MTFVYPSLSPCYKKPSNTWWQYESKSKAVSQLSQDPLNLLLKYRRVLFCTFTLRFNRTVLSISRSKKDTRLFLGFIATDITPNPTTEPMSDILFVYPPRVNRGKTIALVERSCCTSPAKNPKPPPAKMSVVSSSSNMG